MTRRVLVVGGERPSFEHIQEALSQEPYELRRSESPEEAKELLRVTKYSVVAAGETIPGGSGASFLAEVQQKHPATVRLMILDKMAPKALIEAVNQAEIYRFLTPPLQPANVARVLRDALTIARVAEAQEAVWLAAKQQQRAMAELLGPEGSNATDEALSRARYAAQKPAVDAPRIGDLGQEHAQRLSQREREIVLALGAGRRVKDIAQDLVISTHTVRNHLKAIYRKLDVRSQFDLISLMARNGKDG